MAEKKDPKEMGLGKIVREIVINQTSITGLVGGGIGDPKYESNTPLRHELEQRQDQLYGELDRREEEYAKANHTHH